MDRETREPIFQTWDEALELWQSGSRLWLDYLCALPFALTPAAMIDANAKLLADSFNLSGIAAGRRLQDSGWTAPTLNDA